MFARAVAIAALLLLGCSEEPLERLPAPVNEVALAPLPPPPPLPHPVGGTHEQPPREPPRELQDVLAPQPAPPVVMLFELTHGAAEDAFLGYGIARRKKLEIADGKELLLRLADPDAFLDGGVNRCIRDPLGVRIVNSEVTRDVIVDCGNMYFTPSLHDGRFVLLAPALVTYIDSLR